LSNAPEIEEAIVLPTCNRTEFLLWAADEASAIQKVRSLLESKFGLQAKDWTYFYQFVDEAALLHVFRVTASLDSMIVGEPEITGQVKAAWAKAQQARTTGRFLDAVMQKALSLAKRVRNETPIGASAVSIPYAAVELAKQIFGSLTGRKVLVIGAGKMSELSARYLLSNGASALWVTNRTFEHAVELATRLHGSAIPFEDRWQRLADADIVLSSTGCPHIVLDRADLERIRQARHGRPIFLIDIAVPRDIDPAVRELPGVFLYDIDDLSQVVAHNLEERRAAAAQAEKLVAREVTEFRRKLAAQRVVPTISAVHNQLEQLRREELERYRAEFGPLSAAEEKVLDTLTTRLVQRIANQLARELKRVHAEPDRERLADAVRQLFHLHRTLSSAQ
ncbi:MAG TPA: glutamyl-tRNA reductase, partial [Candidatus Nitrosotenuis sp.]|nr:glutamyl-tRNA reductase [Candidatus Nitrosotenuis sp.]